MMEQIARKKIVMKESLDNPISTYIDLIPKANH